MSLRNMGVQAGAPEIEFVKGLQSAVRDVKTSMMAIREELAFTKKMAATIVEHQTRLLGVELTSKFNDAIMKYKESELNTLETLRQSHAQELSENAHLVDAETEASYTALLSSSRDELEELKATSSKKLQEWQRQSYYYKTEMEMLKHENGSLRQLVARNNLKPGSKGKASATSSTTNTSGPLQVHNEARLLAMLDEAKKDVVDITAEADDERTRRRKTEFKFRMYKVQVAMHMERLQRQLEAMKEERDEFALQLKEAEMLSQADGDVAAQALRAQIERRIKKKANEDMQIEIDRVLKRSEMEKAAIVDANDSLISQLKATHRKQMESLVSSQGEQLAAREDQFAQRLEELNASWKKKLEITQQSLSRIGNPEAMAALTAKQAKLLELAERRHKS